MRDLIFLSLVGAFFAGGAAFVRACEAIGGRSDPSRGEQPEEKR